MNYMSNKIPTAEEFSLEHLGDQYVTQNIEDMLIAFAKLHVKAALKAAAEKAKIINDPNSYTGNTGSEYPPDQIVSEKSILSAYPLNLIQ